MDFRYLSISGTSNSFTSFPLNMAGRAGGPGNCVLVPGKGRGKCEFLKVPISWLLGVLKLARAWMLAVAWNSGKAGRFTASLSVSNYFKCHLCSGVFLNLYGCSLQSKEPPSSFLWLPHKCPLKYWFSFIVYVLYSFLQSPWGLSSLLWILLKRKDKSA